MQLDANLLQQPIFVTDADGALLRTNPPSPRCVRALRAQPSNSPPTADCGARVQMLASLGLQESAMPKRLVEIPALKPVRARACDQAKKYTAPPRPAHR